MKTGAHKHVSFFNTVPDITEGVIWKQLLIYFFPILLGTFFQQLYNTMDSIIVGRFLGKEALSAVGGGTGTVVNLLVGFFTGLSAGATVIISQFFGAKEKRDVERAVHTAIALSIVGGIIITIIGIIFAPWLLKLLKTPTEILELAILYIRIFFAGILPTIVYNMGSGILRAIGDSKRPFYYLVVGTFLNIGLDILFIAFFNWGVAGAAIATIISQFVTMLLVCSALIKTTECYKLTLKRISFDGPILSSIIRIGLPAGLQSIMYTISNLVIQTNVNSFGTNTIAAWAAFSKIDAIYWMMINSFGIAITTFAGQNYGAKKFARLRQGVRQCFGLSTIFTVLMIAFLMFKSEFFYRLFTTDEAVVQEGISMLRFIAPMFITYISIEILSGTIRGCGKALIPMLLTCGGVCILRIIWLGIAMPIFPDMKTVMLSYPISWIITGTLFFIYYFYLVKRNFSVSLDNQDLRRHKKHQ